jgi:hypothetical protein
MSYLRYLCLFAHRWCPTHIVLCVSNALVMRVFVLCTLCCQFLWMVLYDCLLDIA